MTGFNSSFEFILKINVKKTIFCKEFFKYYFLLFFNKHSKFLSLKSTNYFDKICFKFLFFVSLS